MTLEATQISRNRTSAYRPFRAHVARLCRLSPSFLRVTFAGEDLDGFASNGRDQRIKVAFPVPGRGVRDYPEGPDWFAAWRAQPPARRNPVRTYTVRATRERCAEVDVDFVLHDGTGPAARWAEQAAPGSEVVLVGPNGWYPGPTGGYEWRPPSSARSLLLAGDETAVPAVCAIVEGLPAGTRALALLEVPTSADVLDVDLPDGVELTWLPRRTPGSPTRTPHGRLLSDAVPDAVRELTTGATPAPRPDDVDLAAGLGVLWDVPAEDAAAPPSGLYAWLAGEAGVVTGLRRALLRDTCVDRSAVAFMGYWREATAEPS